MRLTQGRVSDSPFPPEFIPGRTLKRRDVNDEIRRWHQRCGIWWTVDENEEDRYGTDSSRSSISCYRFSSPSINRKNCRVPIILSSCFTLSPSRYLLLSSLFLFLTALKISHVYYYPPATTAFILAVPITWERERWEQDARERGMGITTECKSPAFRKPRGYSGFAVDPIAFIGAPSFFSLPSWAALQTTRSLIYRN